MVRDHWNCSTKLPTPGIWLQVENTNGEILSAIRPTYLDKVDDKMKGDLLYRDKMGSPVSVKRWRYK